MAHSLKDRKAGPAPGDSARVDEIFRRLTEANLIRRSIGGGVSFKTVAEDPFGRPVEALWYRGAAMESHGLFRLASLKDLSGLEDPQPQSLHHELASSRIHPDEAIPDPACLAHARAARRAAAWITSEPVLALGCVENWPEQVRSSLGPHVITLDPVHPGPAFHNSLEKASQDPSIHAVFLRYHGLMILADDPAGLPELASGFSERAGRSLGTQGESQEPAGAATDPSRDSIAAYRLEASKAAGEPLLVRFHGDAAQPVGTDACTAAWSNLQKDQPRDLPSPPPGLGFALHARRAADLERSLELAQSEGRLRAAASRLGRLELLPIRRERTAFAAASEGGMFQGEVGLVSGAAAGIGKACVESLLARGAAVIALDLKPEIAGMFDDPACLGMVCDLTDETAVIDCMEAGVRAFGGLDMLVLNAGIFPPSRSLEAMTLDHWREVMAINLDANVTLLREAFPLLRRAPRYGRVVINASRNVPAPGPGAAAYSASKAALTQLGRVAALEWAPSRIRVNMLHPHAVFDTGIWTDEVIRSRAAKYGLTVEQYKTNNLLKVELVSRDVGELVAEMLGPVFSKTTGAQIPVDGGSERVV